MAAVAAAGLPPALATWYLMPCADLRRFEDSLLGFYLGDESQPCSDP